MRSAVSCSSLIPNGLAVEQVENIGGTIVVTAAARSRWADCPICHSRAERVHSRYVRDVLDLPCSGRAVRLQVITRRFRCDVATCRRRIFAERFGGDVLAEHARRTARLDCIVHHLGLALGGRPAACLARRLMLPVSNDTLLRTVRRRARSRTEPLAVVGIDDWAWRRNQRYGTIVCDLERRRIVTLLPDREIDTVAAWLAGHPGIRVVARDRGGGYGEATAKALPDAVQVADRWHRQENASAAFLASVKKPMKPIRRAVGATTITPKLLTSAERIQYDGYLRREETNKAVAAMAKAGVPIRQIVRRTGHSRKLVRQIVRGERTDIFRTRQNSLEPHLPFLDSQWEAGCRCGAELWRRLRRQGYGGSLRVVGEWATRRRRSERLSTSQIQKVPAARTVARLMSMGRDHLTKAEAVTVAAIEQSVPSLVEARTLAEQFQSMIRTRGAADLDAWITQADQSLVASFARGVARDKAAVLAAITEPWSNGQTEGQVNKLKLVKRQMYGRAKIDLLQARLLGAP